MIIGFMATSDIAAYFENIQLPILRDSLIHHLPEDLSTVNLLCQILESWCERTEDGRVHHRGIPQGNLISSFLGNFFLLPLDTAFDEFSQQYDVKYFRYMDDVKIFSKSREDARRAILLMARILRKLHLNVQTAKTRIFEHGEVSRQLIDPRVDELSDLIKSIKDNWKNNPIPLKVKSAYLSRLSKISHRKTEEGQRLLGTRMPLEGLNLRAFKRWMYAHDLIKSDLYVRRLLIEISKNSDETLTRKLISVTRQNPKKKSIETTVFKMIQNKQIIFPYQEAECLRALRYLSTLSNDTITHCWNRVIDKSKDRYLRMESSYLLYRTRLSKPQLNSLIESFNEEPDEYVQGAMAGLLVQRKKNNSQIVRELVFHPNEKIRHIGRLFRTVKNDIVEARNILNHTFRNEAQWITVDYMPFLHLMSMSGDVEIKKLLVNSIREPRLHHPIGGLREILKDIFTRTRKSIEDKCHYN